MLISAFDNTSSEFIFSNKKQYTKPTTSNKVLSLVVLNMFLLVLEIIFFISLTVYSSLNKSLIPLNSFSLVPSIFRLPSSLINGDLSKISPSFWQNKFNTNFVAKDNLYRCPASILESFSDPSEFFSTLKYFLLHSSSSLTTKSPISLYPHFLSFFSNKHF